MLFCRANPAPVRVGAPVGNAAPIGRGIQCYARAPLPHTQSITHHRDGRHRDLCGLAGVEATDDAPVACNRGALGQQLLAAVQNRQQILGHGWLYTLKPTHQHRQLAALPRLIARTQQMLVVWRNRYRQASRAGPVAIHMQPAERRIAGQILQRWVLIQVALESFGRDVPDGVGSRLFGKQPDPGKVGQGDVHMSEL